MRCAVGSGVLVDSSGGGRPILTSLQNVYCVFMFLELYHFAGSETVAKLK